MKAWFRYWMPYAFVAVPEEIANLKHAYLPVNRRYKPLGLASLKHVNYLDFLDQAIVFAGDPKKFSGIWIAIEPHLYLYNDGQESRRTYFERFERLMMKKPELLAARRAGTEDWPRTD